jgi:class 3 adenylate cyclase
MMAETRKIAAILAADVVGFSRMASADEDGTLARLRTLRSELIDPTVASQNGRVFKRTGDGALQKIAVEKGLLNFHIGSRPCSLSSSLGVFDRVPKSHGNRYLRSERDELDIISPIVPSFRQIDLRECFS